MKTLLSFTVAALLLVHAGSARAGSDNAFNSRYAIGTVDCWAYADGPVSQMGTSSIASLADGASITVSGPDTSLDPDAVPESATITRVNATTLAYTSTTDNFFAVLKSGDNVEVLYYLFGEVVTRSDSNMRITMEPPIEGGPPPPLPIEAVSLCYQASAADAASAPPAPDPVIPRCPSCSAGGEPALICGFLLDDPHFGGGTNECCVCGSPTSLAQCNPEAPAGAAGSCLGPANKPKAGLDIPTTVEFNKDPYVCTTSGGKRTCYAY